MSQLVQFGASECVSASQLVQVGALERVSRVNWFSSGPRSAYRKSFCRKSFDSDGNFGARIANHFISNHLIQI